MRLIATVAPVLLLLATSGARAQNLTPVDEVPPPPAIVSGEVMPLGDASDSLDAEVTIERKSGATIHAYRVGGSLRAVRIQPSVGPAYYLVDTDGDGDLDHRSNTFDQGLLVNSWVLFSW